VSSQAAPYPDHPQRAYAEIAPLPLKGDAESTLNRLAGIIETLDGGKGVRRELGYTYAQFTTRILKYVDDVEFWLDPEVKVIQVRSVSRLGKSDLGVNRKHIKPIREKLLNS
jgi:uncharacterized protein (DUF1499 family)